MANLIVTDAGLDAIVAAERSGTDTVNVVAVALGTGQYTPSKDQTRLQAEVTRLTAITGGAVSPNVIHVEARDTSTDAYSAYELGVITDDGTLLAVTSGTQPIFEKAAASQALLAVDIVLSDGSSSVFTFPSASFEVPPATTTIQGVVELATTDEALLGKDDVRCMTPADVKAVSDTCVHIEGAETVSGAKTFQTYPLIPTAPAGDASQKAANTAWIKREIVDLVYPVGSIYTSVASTNPKVLFGGTWEAISGRFLLAASSDYTAGSTGGEASHTLTVDESPEHTHTMSITSAGTHAHSATTSWNGDHTHTRGTMEITGNFRTTDMGGWEGAYGAFNAATAPDPVSPGKGYSGSDQVVDFYASRTWGGNTSVSGGHNHTLTTASSGNHVHTVTAASAGGGKPHNNMPPYLAVYVWKRTA